MNGNLMVSVITGRSRPAITKLISNPAHGFGYTEMVEQAFNPSIPSNIRAQYLSLVVTCVLPC